jgi:hypothetical protein
LGCHHALQSVEIWDHWWGGAKVFYEFAGRNVDELEAMARQQKCQFSAYVSEVVRGQLVDFIGEEFRHGVPTSASRVLPNNWHLIEMTEAERARREIPLDYADNEGYTPERRTQWNAERERYMTEEFARKIGTAKSALIICGSEHVRGIADLVTTAGHVVTGRDDVTTKPWFQPPPL